MKNVLNWSAKPINWSPVTLLVLRYCKGPIQKQKNNALRKTNKQVIKACMLYSVTSVSVTQGQGVIMQFHTTGANE